MPAHSRPKDGVASLAYVAGIHVFLTPQSKQDVDGRTKSGHDELRFNAGGKTLIFQLDAGLLGERAPLAHVIDQHVAELLWRHRTRIEAELGER